MTGHVVQTFQSVRKVSFIFRNQPFKKPLEVTTCGGVGILEEKQAGAGVPKKHIRQARPHLTGANQFRYLVGDFIGALSLGEENEFGVIDRR